MIDLSSLNRMQKDAIQNLQKRVDEIVSDDQRNDLIFYYRFLKARDFNLDKAENMLRRHIKWRKHHQVDSILKNFKPKEFFHYLNEKRFICCDKGGDIVLYFPTGKLDGADVLKCVKLNDYMKHVHWFCEKLAADMKQLKEKDPMKCQQLTIISDFDEMSFANITSKEFTEVSLRVMRILQDNFPESLKKLIIINAPPYIWILYNLVKAIVTKAFLQKVQIYGRSEWQTNLLDIIDENVLPAFLGGRRTDPDGNPLCETVISQWNPMPKRYYLPDEDRCFKDKSRVLKIYLFHSSKKDIYFDVKEECSVIEWEFLILKKDVGFGLFLQGSDGIVEILPVQKYDTTDGVERGFYKTTFAGRYFVTFDNTHSWFSSKEVECCITLLRNDI